MARMPGINGFFYDASSMEHLPVKRAIAEQVARFKTIQLRDPVLV
jgi:predicted TIM-barrel enzyme